MAILKPTRGDDAKLAGGLIRIKNDLAHGGQVVAPMWDRVTALVEASGGTATAR
ncbi:MULTISPECIES: hypothetical protein [Cutibacterium]|uniref:hypothetical protein n=1 Tax=Cutibacterium TaxID=1912216 RepID=UPI0003117F95|nr:MULTISPECIES: hypothetical protein [Cutibacterium]MBE3060898.1 hypothetical protein [Cutibacterium acnes]MBR2579725.1 hypothetical protein [Cutibacterium sp.]MBS5257124.1 hypothetical protein [Cutibacterium acnes]MBT9633168.1 hypothetical protein [Cutibacterium acnes]MBU5158802.1 hypothetical protein [Cutibacterium acnes]